MACLNRIAPLLCAVVFLLSCPAWALAPRSQAIDIANQLKEQEKAQERAAIQKFLAQYPLAEGHAHFGGSIDSDVLWNIALKREDIDWDKINAKLVAVKGFENADVKALVQEGKALMHQVKEWGASPEQRDRLRQLQRRFTPFTRYIPESEGSLEEFIAVYSAMPGTLSKGGYDLVKDIAREIALKGYRDGLRLLELRASLPGGKDDKEIRINMQERLKAIRDGLYEAEQIVNASLKKGEIGLETRMVLTAEKNNAMDLILQQTKILLDILDDEPSLREYVVGYDAANPEKQKRPTEFAPVLDLIHEYNARRGMLGEPKLGLTYHVGEDFDDTSIESGIRHVHDVLEMGIGRIGHGLILGINVQQFLGKTREEPLNERIAQIYFDLRNARFDQEGLDLAGLSIDTNALRDELYHLAPNIMDLIHDILKAPSLSLAKQRDLYAILHRVRGPTVSITYTDAMVADLEKRQNYALNKIIENDALIEANPTSNVLIGDIAGYEDHPLKKFLHYRYPASAHRSHLTGKRPVVTINTDDPGVFGTNTAEEFIRMALAQGFGVDEIKRMIVDGFRYRLSGYPLRFRDEIMQKLGPDVEKELTGFHIARTRFGDVQFGIPPETAHNMMKRHADGKSYPTSFVLPPDLFVGRINYADVEFAIFFQSFVLRDGQVVDLICTPQQQKAMRKYLEQSLFGIDIEGQAWKAYRKKWIADMARAKGVTVENAQLLAEIHRLEKTFAAAQDVFRERDASGHKLDLSDYVRFHNFQNGSVSLKKPSGALDIKQDPAHRYRFTVQEVADEQDKGRRFPMNVDYTRPFLPLAPPKPADKAIFANGNRPRFGYTVLGRNNGYDVYGETSSFILWVGGKGILVDPSHAALQRLEQLGLTETDISYVLLTHNHSDDDSGLLQWIFKGQRTKILASHAVYFGFHEKASALLGEDIDLYVDHVPLLETVDNAIPMIGDEKAILRIHRVLHSIPTDGFVLAYEHKGRRYELGVSGDDCFEQPGQGRMALFESALRNMGLNRVQRKKSLREMLKSFWDKDGELPKTMRAILQAVETGDKKVSGIHPRIETLERLPAKTRSRMVLYHANEKEYPFDGFKNVTGLQTVAILPSDQQIAQMQALQMISVLALLANTPRENIRSMLLESRVQQLQPGEMLIKKDAKDTGAHAPQKMVYIVLDGELRVVGDDGSVKTTLPPWTMVGEWGALLDIPRAANVEAGVGGATVLPLTMPMLDRLKKLSEARDMVRNGMDNLPVLQAMKRSRRPHNPFRDVGNNALADIAMKARRERLSQGEIIVRQGDAADGMYIIRKGKVKVTRDGNSMPMLGEGEFFGEAALLDLDKEGFRNATVEAEGDVTLMKISKEQFQNTLKAWPAFQREMRAVAGERAGQAVQTPVDILLSRFVSLVGSHARKVGKFSNKNFPLYEIGEGMDQREMYWKAKGDKEFLYALNERLAYELAHALGFKNIQRVQLTDDNGWIRALVEKFANAEPFATDKERSPLYHSNPQLRKIWDFDYPAWLAAVRDPFTFVESDLFRYFCAHEDTKEPENVIVRQFGEKWEATFVDYEYSQFYSHITSNALLQVVRANRESILRYGMRFMEAVAHLKDEQIAAIMNSAFEDLRPRVPWFDAKTFERERKTKIAAIALQRNLFREIYENLTSNKPRGLSVEDSSRVEESA